MGVECYESTFFVRIFYKYLIFKIYCGETGSRTYAFRKYHKIANH